MPILRIEGHRTAEARLDRPHAADGTCAQPAPHAGVDRQEARPERLHQKHIPVPGLRDDLACRGKIRYEGLLAEHGPTRRQAFPDEGSVSGVRRRDVYGVDGGVGEQRREVRRHQRRRLARAGPVCDELSCCSGVTAEDAARVHARQPEDRIRETMGDESGADDRPREIIHPSTRRA
jgi:hypothetical protein